MSWRSSSARFWAVGCRRRRTSRCSLVAFVDFFELVLRLDDFFLRRLEQRLKLQRGCAERARRSVLRVPPNHRNTERQKRQRGDDDQQEKNTAEKTLHQYRMISGRSGRRSLRFRFAPLSNVSSIAQALPRPTVSTPCFSTYLSASIG